MKSTSTTAVILCNLGTPEDPSPASIRQFLKAFLSDPRVVEIPRPIWLTILYCFILPFRPKPLSHAYQALWDEYGDSPLRIIAKQQVEKLQTRFEQSGSNSDVLVDYAFAYTPPSIASKIEEYREKADSIILLPLYPQYSCSTTAAFYDQVAAYTQKERDIPEVMIIKDYYQHPAYRQALASSVKDFWEANGKADMLLVSNHGVPKRYADLGDPYYQQCLDTVNNLKTDLSLSDDECIYSFQSRLGKAEWLTPYTDVTVKELAQRGIKRIDVVCPSFSVDCLETLEEIAVENAGYFCEAGGEELRLVPCLNADEQHIGMMYQILEPYLQLKKSRDANSSD